MQPCKYVNITKCESCDAIFYAKCKKFVKVHTEFLVRRITPFKFSKQSLGASVVWSKDMNKSKSAALQFAVSKNSEVMKLSLNQVISLTISNEEIDGKVFYIECASKIQGDLEKVLGVLSSFVDKVMYSGACVSIYVAPSLPLSITEYKRL